MDQTKPIIINNFVGGYCGNLPITNLQLNQASDLDNIVIKPNGQGFRSRLGNTKFNASALNSGANIQGIGYLLQSDGDNYLVAIAGDKVYQSTSLSGTFADITGSVTITSGASNKWDLYAFDDDMIGFGGPPANPDTPLIWTGSGNAAALSGTPPAAYGGFAANNRCFAYRTAANPSTIYWSIIGNSQDWTGVGSGNSTIGSLGDNQKITCAIVISTNYVLVFKETSTFQMVISQAPFPVYSLFDAVGCVGKHAAVNIDGMVYFINSRREMVSTDGEKLYTYPQSMGDLWELADASALPNIEGIREKGADYDWIVWVVTISGTKRALVWDLLNKCWLRNSTGYAMNLLAKDNLQNIYMGGTDGFIYKPSQAATYSDASTGAAINSYWRGGWINPSVNNEIVQVSKAILTYQTKASGSITLNYGFDFNLDSGSASFSQVASGTELYTSRLNVLTRRGNFFNYKIGLNSSTIDMNVQSLTLRGKVYGQKRISAS